MLKGGFIIQDDGTVSQVPEDIHVKHSLRNLILTRVRERELYPEYGDTIHDILFRIITPGIFDEVEERIKQLIKKHEPRINLQNINVEQTKAEKVGLNIHLTYVIKNTNKVEVLHLNMNQ